MKKPEYLVATAVMVGALLVVLALSLAIGKLNLISTRHRLHVRFESVAGLNLNSSVKYAGATVGRVTKISVLPLSEQRTGTEGPYCIELELGLDPKVELNNDIAVAIKQDGLLGSKYIGITPQSIENKPLDMTRVLYGQNSVELTDLAGPGKDLITKLQPVAQNLGPIVSRLDTLTAKLDASLPDVINNLDSITSDGSELLSTINTPEGRDRVVRLLANLRVVSDNLKVVSSNAKSLTATLAEKPWRLIFGGKTVPVPKESDILRSDVAIPYSTNVLEASKDDLGHSRKDSTTLPRKNR